MSNKTRMTRECGFGEFSPDAVAEILRHLERYGLEAVETNAVFCGETVTTETKKGFFSTKASKVVTSFLLTPEWLVWAAGREGETPAVLSVKLADITIQDYEATEMFLLVADTGISITGRATDVSQNISAFIGLGPEPAALEFREILRSHASAFQGTAAEGSGTIGHGHT
jgi:hypothetical protein